MNHENSRKLPSLSLFFPAYNEEGNLEALICQALEVAAKIATTYEVVIVDDGSRDSTFAIAKRWSEKDPHVRVVTQENKGYGGAVKRGFAQAQYEWVFFSDADLQFNLRELAAFIPGTQDNDVMIGYRLNRADGLRRLTIAKLLKLWNKVFLGFPWEIKDIDCAFKLIHRSVLNEVLPLVSDGAMISTELLLKAHERGFRFSQVGVRHYPRRVGTSTGNNPQVIIKAIRETFLLRNQLRRKRDSLKLSPDTSHIHAPMENVSFVIPVFNEEQVIHSFIQRLLHFLEQSLAQDVEIVVVNNGSTDHTSEILEKLTRTSSLIRAVHLPFADFGTAVKEGLKRASKKYAFLLNADWWDPTFLTHAYSLRSQADIVSASKLLASQADLRPPLRRAGTLLLSWMVRMMFGYKGTDTHGLKLMNLRTIVPLLKKCSLHELLETELVLRAQRKGLRIRELPTRIWEVRPSRTSFLHRSLRVLKEILVLTHTLKNEAETKQILHADDVGYNTASVISTLQLWKARRVTTASLLVNFSAFSFAAQSLNSSGIAAMLHVNLVEGQPISSPETVPSLIDAEGYFFPLPIFLLRTLLRRVKDADVEREVRAQLMKARQENVDIIGLDSHRHTHMFSPIAEVFARIEQEEGFSSSRMYGNFKTLTFKGMLKREVAAAAAFLSSLVNSRRLSLPHSWAKHPSAPSFAVASWEPVDSKALSTHRLNLLVVHPGLPFDHTRDQMKLRDSASQGITVKLQPAWLKTKVRLIWSRYANPLLADLDDPWFGLGYFLRSLRALLRV